MMQTLSSTYSAWSFLKMKYNVEEICTTDTICFERFGFWYASTKVPPSTGSLNSPCPTMVDFMDVFEPPFTLCTCITRTMTSCENHDVYYLNKLDQFWTIVHHKCIMRFNNLPWPWIRSSFIYSVHFGPGDFCGLHFWSFKFSWGVPLRLFLFSCRYMFCTPQPACLLLHYGRFVLNGKLFGLLL